MTLTTTYGISCRSLLKHSRIGIVILLMPLLLVIGPLRASAQATETIKPNDNLVIVGIPPVPASLANEVKPYLGIYGLPLAGWDTTKREIQLKGLSSVTWLSNIETPGASPKI